MSTETSRRRGVPRIGGLVAACLLLALAAGAASFTIAKATWSAARTTSGEVDARVTDMDDDGDGFLTSVELYLGTDHLDACPDIVGGDDAWPLDINMDTFITAVGDVLNYSGRIGATGGPPPTSNWWQRLDLNMDNHLTVVGDVLKYYGRIGETCA